MHTIVDSKVGKEVKMERKTYKYWLGTAPIPRGEKNYYRKRKEGDPGPIFRIEKCRGLPQMGRKAGEEKLASGQKNEGRVEFEMEIEPDP